MKIKKILIVSSIILFLLPAFSFAQENQSEDSVAQTSAPAGKTDSVREKRESKKSEKTSKKQNFAGWINPAKRNIDQTYGLIELKSKNKLGSFNILVKNDENKSISVLSNGNEFTSSAFFLKINKNIYRLGADFNTKVAARKNPAGMEIAYDIDELAFVNLNFDCLKAVEDGDTDILKITLTVKNNTGKTADFSVKAILDTVLGERNSYHFYLPGEIPILNETCFRYPHVQPYILSKNNYAAVQVLFEGYDTTQPEMVALANYATLNTATWEPDMMASRSFDTVTSYNNSAMGILWPSKKLKSSETMKVTFYIAVAADGRKPEGETFIAEKTKVANPEEKADGTAVEKTVAEEPAEKTAENVEVEQIVETDADENEREIPNVKFDVATLSKEQFTPEYIQGLLNKIQALEASDPALNREQILLLNAELDAILEALR